MPRRKHTVRDHDAAALVDRMTDDDVMRFLREVRFSDSKDRQFQRTAYSINAIAKQAGVRNSRIYEIIAGRIALNSRVKRAVERLTRV